jgi:Tfp pilus assembly protein PilN
MATMIKTALGWRLRKTNEWPSINLPQNALLLSRSVLCGISAHWQPLTESSQEYPGSLLYPRTNESASLACEQLLAANCAGMVPDDAFLCTLPLALGETKAGKAGSFISVFKEAAFYKIGVTLDESLCAVFNLAPVQPGMLESHLGRISRFFQRLRPDLVFPTQVFCLGFSAPDMPPYAITTLDSVPGDKQTMLAAGVALAHVAGQVPALRPATPRYALRRVRAALYGASAACMLVTLLACAAFPLAHFFLAADRDSGKARYQALLNANADIREMTSASEALAHKIIDEQAITLKQTRWTQVLQFLGDSRPAGLWFDMLGSETLNGQTGTARLAFSGWADNESKITSFISLLQKSGLAADVSLTSLDRDAAKNVFLFRIVCTAKLYGLPITK